MPLLVKQANVSSKLISFVKPEVFTSILLVCSYLFHFLTDSWFFFMNYLYWSLFLRNLNYVTAWPWFLWGRKICKYIKLRPLGTLLDSIPSRFIMSVFILKWINKIIHITLGGGGGIYNKNNFPISLFNLKLGRNLLKFYSIRLLFNRKLFSSKEKNKGKIKINKPDQNKLPLLTTGGSNNEESSTKKINIDFLIEDKTSKAIPRTINATLPKRHLTVFNSRNSVVSAIKQPLIPVVTGDNSCEENIAGLWTCDSSSLFKKRRGNTEVNAITISQNDRPYLLFIQRLLEGIGRIQLHGKFKGTQEQWIENLHNVSWDSTLDKNPEEVIIFIQVINGRIASERRLKEFQAFVLTLDQDPDFRDLWPKDFYLQTRVVNVSWDTSCLAGLLGADGNFNISKRADTTIRIKRTTDTQLLEKVAEGIGLGYVNNGVWAISALGDVERMIKNYLSKPVGQLSTKKFIDVLKFRYIVPIVRQYRLAKGDAQERKLLLDRITFLRKYIVKHSVLFIDDPQTEVQVKLAYPVFYPEIQRVIFGNLETGQVWCWDPRSSLIPSIDWNATGIEDPHIDQDSITRVFFDQFKLPSDRPASKFKRKWRKKSKK